MIQNISMRDVDFGKKLVQSLKDTGFAVVRDHGINKDLIDDAYYYWAMFYGSELEFKEKFKYNPKENIQGGYFPMKSENAKGYKASDLKEFFHFYRASDLPFPPVKVLGQYEAANITSGPMTIINLFNSMEEAGMRILTEINNNLPNDVWRDLSMDLEVMASDSPATLLRSIHYPPIKDDDTADGAVRAAAHEDINLITLLPAATASGLEVKDAEGNWHTVETSGNDLVVNVGDLLQEATGGYLKSTTHRVVNTEEGKTQSRYSMPFFIHPWPNVKIGDKTAEELLVQRLKEIGLKNANK